MTSTISRQITPLLLFFLYLVYLKKIAIDFRANELVYEKILNKIYKHRHKRNKKRYLFKILIFFRIHYAAQCTVLISILYSV